MIEKMETENYKFFQHKQCEFFPCHKIEDTTKFSCLFCYCPLYSMGTECGGNYKLMENGIKDCTYCLVPHTNYDYIIEKLISSGKEKK